jgi:TolB protein
MRKIFFLLLLVGWGMNLELGVAEAKVYIDIRSPSFRKFPIAIRPFRDSLSPHAEMRLGFRATEILRDDLDISGFFTFVEGPGEKKRSGTEGSLPLPESLRRAQETELVDFQPWAQAGAEALVVGKVFYQDRSLILEARLYDVVKKEMIVGKRYVGEITDLSRMVHRFADEIIFAITGEQGFFQTKIIYVSKASGYKELYMMDFDGRNPMQLTHHKSICLSPRASPDGRSVAFTSYKMGNPDVFI